MNDQSSPVTYDECSSDMLYLPKLYLAPMEGVADRSFRQATARYFPHFDEATTEFIRLPRGGHIPSLIASYDPRELGEIPLAAQIMTSCPQGAGQMAQALAEKGAQRIELNCGCPSNRVAGRGAGSALLEEPKQLVEILLAMEQAVDQRARISVKIRSGYSDASRFEELLSAIAGARVAHLTIHPRTKVEGYRRPCHWRLFPRARKRVDLPLVGSGEIVTPLDATHVYKLLLGESRAPQIGLMVGRAAVGKPWIFSQIRHEFAGKSLSSWHEDYFGEKEGLGVIALCWLHDLFARWQRAAKSPLALTRRLKQQIHSLFDPRLYPHWDEASRLLLLEVPRKALLRSQESATTLLEETERAWRLVLAKELLWHKSAFSPWEGAHILQDSLPQEAPQGIS